MQVYPVLSADCLSIWEWVEPLIGRVCSDESVGFSTEDILTKLQTRQMQLWVVPEKAAMVTQVLVYPQHKVLLVPILAGDDMDEWLPDIVETLVFFAKHMGCKYIEERGRPGWGKVLDKDGFRKAFVTLRKEV